MGPKRFTGLGSAKRTHFDQGKVYLPRALCERRLLARFHTLGHREWSGRFKKFLNMGSQRKRKAVWGAPNKLNICDEKGGPYNRTGIYSPREFAKASLKTLLWDTSLGQFGSGFHTGDPQEFSHPPSLYPGITWVQRKFRGTTLEKGENTQGGLTGQKGHFNLGQQRTLSFCQPLQRKFTTQSGQICFSWGKTQAVEFQQPLAISRRKAKLGFAQFNGRLHC